MINELNQNEIEKILAVNTLGRLGCISDGKPYVVPVYYHFDGESIYIHSLPGKKIEALRKHHGACLLVDEIEDPYRWREIMQHWGIRRSSRSPRIIPNRKGMCPKFYRTGLGLAYLIMGTLAVS